MSTVVRGDVDRAALRSRVEEFVDGEIDLLDRHDYWAWADLWDDDGVYWIPIGDPDYDPADRVSIINDDVGLLHARIRRVLEGGAYAEDPASDVTRVVSNIHLDDVVAEGPDASIVHVRTRFIAVSSRRGRQTLWAGRILYRLRMHGDSLKIVGKTVLLSNSREPLTDFVFLL